MTDVLTITITATGERCDQQTSERDSLASQLLQVVQVLRSMRTTRGDIKGGDGIVHGEWRYTPTNAQWS